jgi:hypothetical protein
MKIGDLVRPSIDQSWLIKEAIGVILESKTMISTHGLSTDQISLRGKDLNSHKVYWSTPISNTIWVKERDLERAI